MILQVQYFRNVIQRKNKQLENERVVRKHLKKHSEELNQKMETLQAMLPGAPGLLSIEAPRNFRRSYFSLTLRMQSLQKEISCYRYWHEQFKSKDSHRIVVRLPHEVNSAERRFRQTSTELVIQQLKQDNLELKKQNNLFKKEKFLLREKVLEVEQENRCYKKNFEEWQSKLSAIAESFLSKGLERRVTQVIQLLQKCISRTTACKNWSSLADLDSTEEFSSSSLCGEKGVFSILEKCLNEYYSNLEKDLLLLEKEAECQSKIQQLNIESQITANGGSVSDCRKLNKYLNEFLNVANKDISSKTISSEKLEVFCVHLIRLVESQVNTNNKLLNGQCELSRELDKYQKLSQINIQSWYSKHRREYESNLFKELNMYARKFLSGREEVSHLKPESLAQLRDQEAQTPKYYTKLINNHPKGKSSERGNASSKQRLLQEKRASKFKLNLDLSTISLESTQHEEELTSGIDCEVESSQLPSTSNHHGEQIEQNLFRYRFETCQKGCQADSEVKLNRAAAIEIEKKLNKLSQQNMELTAELKQKVCTISNQKSSISRKTSYASQLKSNNATLQGKLDITRKQNDEQQIVIRNLRKKCQILESKGVHLKAAHEKLTEEVKNIKSRAERLGEENGRLYSKVRRLSSRIELLSRAKNTLEEKVSLLEKECQHCSKRKTKQQEHAKRMKRERNKLNQVMELLAFIQRNILDVKKAFSKGIVWLSVMMSESLEKITSLIQAQKQQLKKIIDDNVSSASGKFERVFIEFFKFVMKRSIMEHLSQSSITRSLKFTTSDMVSIVAVKTIANLEQKIKEELRRFPPIEARLFQILEEEVCSIVAKIKNLAETEEV